MAGELALPLTRHTTHSVRFAPAICSYCPTDAIDAKEFVLQAKQQLSLDEYQVHNLSSQIRANSHTYAIIIGVGVCNCTANASDNLWSRE
jgi:hypothetical protein